MCTDILYDQRDAARPKGQGDVLHDGRLVGQHKDDEGDEEEQRRELDNGKTCNLANHIGRSRAAGGNLVAQSGDRDAYSAEGHRHTVGEQRNQCREHRLETEANQDSCRDGHCRTEASHTFEEATEAPHENQDDDTLVVADGSELLLDHLNLLVFHKDVVAVDSHQDDYQDREDGLEDTLDECPPGDANDAFALQCLGNHVQSRSSKDSEQTRHDKRDKGALPTWHLKAKHQGKEQ